jgi:hypothetical protein
MKYRHKPTIIEAIQFTSGDLRPMLDAWGADFGRAVIEQHGDHYLLLSTLEGQQIVSRNDWIIEGVEGEFYACKPSIFEASYEQYND